MKDKETSKLEKQSYLGTKYLIFLQIFTRIITFTLNQLLFRFISPKSFGIATVQFELLLSTCLFLSREGLRSSLYRFDIIKYKKVNDKQLIYNTLNLPLLISFIVIPISGLIYVFKAYSIGENHPYYYHSLFIYCISCFVELSIEPYYNFNINLLNYKLRVYIEGSSILLKCLVTFFICYFNLYLGFDIEVDLLAFSFGQLTYAISTYIGYRMNAQIFNKQFQFIKLKSLKHEKENAWFNPELKSLTYGFMKQSALKHILTEGDKILLTFIGSNLNQGEHSFANHYGSLIARILFQPLEETSRVMFSKLLKKEKNPSKEEIERSYTILSLLVKFQIILGLIFIFLVPHYVSSILFLLLGKKSEWILKSNSINTLKLFCYYIPVMGLNGISESFVQAVSDEKQLEALNYFMIIFSVLYIGLGVILLNILNLGASGLVIANIVSMLFRIGYSYNFIQKFYRLLKNSNSEINLNYELIYLSKTVLLITTLSGAFAYYSSQSLDLNIFKDIGLHILIGVSCFSLIMTSLYLNFR